MKIFPPTDGPIPGTKIESTRIYVAWDRTFTEFPDFRVEYILHFSEDGYRKAEIGLHYFDIDVEKVNEIVNDTVSLFSQSLSDAEIYASGDYQDGAMLSQLDTYCLVQWVAEEPVLAASFSLRDHSDNESLGYENAFGITLQVS